MEIVAWFAVGIFVGWMVSDAMLLPRVIDGPKLASMGLLGEQSRSRAESHAEYRPQSLFWRLTRRRTFRD